MSGKRSKFLTRDNEHWYIDTMVTDNGESRVVLEFDASNIIECHTSDYDVEITLRGDCELSRLLRGARFPDEDWLKQYPRVRVVR